MGCFFWCPRNSNKKKKLDSNDLKAQVVIGFKATAQDQDYNPSTPADASTFNRRSDCKKDVNGKGKESEHASPSSSAKEPNIKVESNTSSSKVRIFAYQQLVDATENFRSDCFLGEGGFGRVYKGQLADTNKVVAIKQLDHNGLQGIRGFVVEVLILSQTDHPNLMKLMGYCAERDQRLLVYEYMPLGSLEHYLHDQRPKQKALDWNTRMKIAAGVARAIEYLHDKMKPPIIYRDLKCSSILLAKDYHPKLSNFGLAKVGPVGEKTHVSTRVMGTHGCCAPEYAMTGQLTFKSDVYSVGVVLLEIITGRKAIDNTKDAGAQNLVAWARPMFKDKRKFGQMADPALKGGYPIRGLYQALAVAAMCVQEQPNMRPPMADVVTALNYLASQKYDPQLHAFQCQRTSSSTSRMTTATRENADKKVDVARDRLESG